MNTRRDFLSKISALAGAASILPFQEALAAKLNQIAPSSIQSNEDFWWWVKQQYSVSPTIINMNNGGVCPQPKIVQDAFEKYNRMSNEGPSYYMWRVLDRGRESLRSKLAELAGCTADELAINRNTTEALDTIIFGLSLNKGDEIILSKYDYPNMINAWKQRAKRDGVVLKWVDFEFPEENEQTIVAKFKEKFTTKTRIVHVTHMINWVGQLLPAKAIADAAHEIGAEVIIDGAHTFGHFEYKITDLAGDYYGTSLHKWLCAPFGTGFMYVKKDKIAKLWPTCPSENPESEDIRKFEGLGTRSLPAEYAIGQAIDFHLTIGSKRKEQRLRYLKDYWVNQVAELPGIKMYTSLRPEFSCGIATFGIEGIDASKIEQSLFKEQGIHTVAIKREAVNGVRVSPNVYTSTRELDRLVKGIKNLTV